MAWAFLQVDIFVPQPLLKALEEAQNIAPSSGLTLFFVRLRPD